MQGDNHHGDCYSAGERNFMRWGQRIRQTVFAPLIRLLAARSVTPNQVTFASLLAGAASVIALYHSVPLALGLILLHLLFDGIDGPLARYRDMQSDQGSFSDSAVDQVVLTGVCFALIDLGVLHPVIGGMHVLLYTLVVGFAMIRNHLGVPYGFLVRPRFFVYSWVLIEFFYWPGSLDLVVALFNAPLMVYVVSGFFQIRRKL